jgi:hypothetical protein
MYVMQSFIAGLLNILLWRPETCNPRSLVRSWGGRVVLLLHQRSNLARGANEEHDSDRIAALRQAPLGPDLPIGA